MNQKALLQLGSELMHQFRHGQMPADRALGDYVRDRKFLGSRDKHFLGDVFYYALRHLRRIDEAIFSAFAGMMAAEERYSSGFPITAPMGAAAWARRAPGEPAAQRPDQRNFDRMVDTIRLGLAALELKLEITAEEVAEELEQAWPPLPGKRMPQKETLLRLLERALEIMGMYAENTKPIHQERAFSYPGWLWAQMSAGQPDEQLKGLAASLNKPADAVLRVNTLRTTPDAAFEELRAAKLEFRRSKLVEGAMILNKRYPAKAIPHSREGWYEFQDEGSQLISLYCAPQAGWIVVDACAGGGGKAMHLAALMKNDGRILALDNDAERLEDVTRRAQRDAAHAVGRPILMPTNGQLPPETRVPPADLVLIDAPCSGTGTLRRNPDIRWRLTPSYLESLRETQAQLLRLWAPRVKPGGFLVYATCSLLRVENEDQVDAFVREFPEFQAAPPENFTPELTKRGELRLYPHVHGCDGFFAARLQKKA